jgi:hypothetical protein
MAFICSQCGPGHLRVLVIAKPLPGICFAGRERQLEVL